MPDNSENIRENIVNGLMEAVTACVKTSISLVDVYSRQYISKGEFEKLISMHRDIQKVLGTYEIGVVDE